MADSSRLNILKEFVKCYPQKVNRDKNNSQGLNSVMVANAVNQKNAAKPPQPTKKVSVVQPQSELDYVKHLVSLVLTRMEDKHRNQTEVFLFLDQRGKNKVSKKDFATAVERLRISLSREDVTKVWNYIDCQQQGYITLGELSIAYANRVSNFGKNVENVVEKMASDGYNKQAKTGNDVTQNAPPVGSALKAQKDQFKVQTGARSPMTTKSMEHIYGAQNLASDEIGALVNNHWMAEAAEMTRQRNDVVA